MFFYHLLLGLVIFVEIVLLDSLAYFTALATWRLSQIFAVAVAVSMFRPGDRVFAKMKGFPFWPARVCRICFAYFSS